MIQAIVFDAYGTLFDVYSISKLAEQLFPGRGTALAELWRERQIEYTRLRTLCDRYVNFENVTSDALHFSCEKLGLATTGEKHTELLTAYRKLQAFPENLAALEALKQAGFELSILSNGNLEMLEPLVQANQFSHLFAHLLSADSVQKFKTAPEVYQLVANTYADLPLNQILFVSSNCWDVCAAVWFGYQTFWVNRYRAPLERLDVKPDAEGYDLNDLLNYALIKVKA